MKVAYFRCIGRKSKGDRRPSDVVLRPRCGKGKMQLCTFFKFNFRSKTYYCFYGVFTLKVRLDVSASLCAAHAVAYRLFAHVFTIGLLKLLPIRSKCFFLGFLHVSGSKTQLK